MLNQRAMKLYEHGTLAAIVKQEAHYPDCNERNWYERYQRAEAFADEL
jgi:hypothetical protein